MFKGFGLGLRPRGAQDYGIRRVILCCAVLVVFSGASGERAAAQARTQAGAPGVMVTPLSLSFPDTAAGAISVAKVVTVTNSGTAVLNITGLDVNGSPLPDFSYNTSCVLPLPAGSSCTIEINFAPLVIGPRTAQLVINDDAADSPQSVALTGNALEPYAISATGSTTAMVTAGQAAIYNMQFVPVEGFFGSVQIQCNGAPRGATCTTIPATVAVSGVTGAVPFIVKLATAGTKAGAGPGEGEITPPGTYMVSVAAVWATISKKTTLTLTVQ
jgi:hypothetical protein